MNPADSTFRGGAMTTAAEAERFKQLYDVERHVMATDGGVLVEDPYPAFAELRAQAPVHAASVSELLGYPASRLRQRGAGAVYSAFSYEANDIVLRENQIFSSTVYAGMVTQLFGGRTILEMVGDEHRRYRALAQPAFSPKRAQWWTDNWIATLVDEAISAFEPNGQAELNAELCSRIPLQTITSSFGLTRQEALDFREGAEGGGMQAIADASPEVLRERAERTTSMLRRVIEDRRAQPQDDLISALVQSEIEEDGERHLLTDDEIFGFSRLVLTAGSGTTWRQLGILLIALLRRPDLLDAVREDRNLLRRSIDEAVRWEPTDPIFRRLVTKDVTLSGVDIPAGAVMEMNLGSANHDETRWDDPEHFDPYRPLKPNLGFAGGPHVCLGMHVARAEMWVAMNAVLDRLPNLRFDPDVPNVRIIGLEHRGPNGIPVLFG
jgi:cytochrome P450